MSDLAIRVEQLGKRYILGQREQYGSLRESLSRLVTAPFRRAQREEQASFWALRELSFSIEQGEVVGIIGRNGAGKSTLLKLLTRITEPTEGRITTYGRVASLLEVGTGFHPELTGRENIFMNGAILGMGQAEITRKFDDIVAFAEVERFLDTPVKRYSSGMYVRLAFAVAAHLESEILLIDEVLAVGDANFQQKCLGKMGEVARGGRTVLFVSHQMNAVQALCPSCIWLAHGQLVEQGETRGLISRYLFTDGLMAEWRADTEHPLAVNPYFTPRRLAVVDRDLVPIQGCLGADQSFGVLIEGEATAIDPALEVGFTIISAHGETVLWAQQTDTEQAGWPTIRSGENRLVAWLPAHFLNEGDYRIEMTSTLFNRDWLVQPGVNAPSVQLSIRGGLSASPYWTKARPGVVAPIIPFHALEAEGTALVGVAAGDA